VRKAAVDAIEKELGDILSVEPWLSLITDSDYSVRHAAIKNLGRTGDPVAIEPLLTALTSDGNNVTTVIEALNQFRDPRVTEPLLLKLQSIPDNLSDERGQCDDVRDIVQALSRFGQQAVAPLCEALKCESKEVRFTVAEALGAFGDKQAIAPLIGVLNDVSLKVRCSAIRSLGELGDPRAVVSLSRQYNNDDAGVRWAVISALGKIRTADAALAISYALRDKSAEIQKRAITLLAETRHVEAIGALADFMSDVRPQDSSRDLRIQCVKALGEIGRAEALPLLKNRLSFKALGGEQDEHVRSAIADAIERIEDGIAKIKGLPRSASDVPVPDRLPRPVSGVPILDDLPRSSSD